VKTKTLQKSSSSLPSKPWVEFDPGMFHTIVKVPRGKVEFILEFTPQRKWVCSAWLLSWDYDERLTKPKSRKFDNWLAAVENAMTESANSIDKMIEKILNDADKDVNCLDKTIEKFYNGISRKAC